MQSCTECGALVKPTNLPRHMHKVHSARSYAQEIPGKTGSGKAAARKQAVEQRARRLGVALFVACAAILLVGSYYLFSNFIIGSNTHSYEPTNSLSSQTGEDSIRIPIDNITEDADFYSFDSDGTAIRFFAVRGSDSEVHVAFDACDSCHPEKKGYRQASNSMKCNNCGREFAINSIGTENKEGGCWPSYLPIAENQDAVMVEMSDLEEKRYMFD